MGWGDAVQALFKAMDRGHRSDSPDVIPVYDIAECVAALERRGIRAHVARKVSGSAIDGRAARGKGYAMSLLVRLLQQSASG